MTSQRYTSFAQWFGGGPFSPYVRMMKSPGGCLSLIETAMPAVEMSDPAVPELVLHQDLRGGFRLQADLGSGRFSATSRPNDLFLAAPDFANSVAVDSDHLVRSIAFPVRQWARFCDDSLDGALSFDFGALHRGAFTSTQINAAQRQLWRLCDEEGAPSRLLAQAAGCVILAELFRLTGAPLTAVRGGLSPWAEKRCVDMMHARLSEDISLDELAAEAQLSPFHFARMFKQSVGVPPRVYLTQLRIEKACELLEHANMSITEIAQEVGYSSNQVLARAFMKHRYMSPTDYRRAVRN
ncbi:MAG: helix-turn-helix domain-containing protein [Aliihoeflea sp.]